MPPALRAVHLHALHSVGRIAVRGNRTRIGGLREARPAAPALELLLGTEQLRAAAGAEVAPGPVIVPERSGECPLGALLAQDPVLLGRQLSAPLLVGLLDAISHDRADCKRSRARRSASETASSASFARTIASEALPALESSQVSSPTTGLRIFSAKAISDRVPNS